MITTADFTFDKEDRVLTTFASDHMIFRHDFPRFFEMISTHTGTVVTFVLAYIKTQDGDTQYAAYRPSVGSPAEDLTVKVFND
ncbi:MAG: hypothetical protein WCY93_12120 [Anaerolineaceae bacterium]